MIFQIAWPSSLQTLLTYNAFVCYLVTFFLKKRGAMENWGCVTYREAKILVEPGEGTSESTKRGIARTVCHELAHQWFGNLVTMDWWTQVCVGIKCCSCVCVSTMCGISKYVFVHSLLFPSLILQ
jgi:hypothetical protein